MNGTVTGTGTVSRELVVWRYTTTTHNIPSPRASSHAERVRYSTEKRVHALAQCGLTDILGYVSLVNPFPTSTITTPAGVVTHCILFYRLRATVCLWPTSNYIINNLFFQIQFVMIVFQYMLSVRASECPPSRGITIFVASNTTFILLLFLNFYKQSYTRKGAGKSISNGCLANGLNCVQSVLDERKVK